MYEDETPSVECYQMLMEIVPEILNHSSPTSLYVKAFSRFFSNEFDDRLYSLSLPFNYKMLPKFGDKELSMIPFDENFHPKKKK